MTQRSGQLLGGRWRVLAQVNSGGQGRVCTVTDVQTSEKYAAKVFKIKGYEQRRLARAKVEIEAIKKLEGSTNVVQIKDENILSTEPGSPVELFYIMDYALYGSLADNDFYIGDVEQCLRMFKEILLGVREAHRKGVIHRDLKPANILLYPTQRQVVVTDFGLGLIKDREANEKITEPDELVGPRFFISPEQYVNPSDANERSDIYSLGKILYYMLTGKGKVFREQIDDINKDLKEPNPYIPQVQELLLNRMVAEKPTDRFIDVEEAIDAVDRILSQIEANSQRYLHPANPSEDMYVLLGGSRRDILIDWFKQDIVLALGALEGVIGVLRKEDKPRTLESLKEDLLKRFTSGKINAAIKSVIAYVTSPQDLAAMQQSSRFSFPSYYMARYYVQSLAYGTAHTYIVKALDVEKDSALQLHYLLTFEEISRKCNCILTHDYDQRMLLSLRKADDSERAYLLRVLGQHYLKLGQHRKGLRFLEAYLDAKPYHHSVRFDCAYAYAQLDETALAVHHYTILAENSEYSEKKDSVLNNLGVAYDALNMPGVAIAKYREAYELGSTLAGANVAGRYLQIGMFEEAKEILDEIITNYPKTYHENVATHLGAIVERRRAEASRQKELEASGAFLKHHHVQAIRAFISENQFSWVGRWSFGEYKFDCLEHNGVHDISALEPRYGQATVEFKATVDGSCLEISKLKKPFDSAVKSGLFYLTSDHTFSGCLITEGGKFEDVTGNRC